MTVWNYKFNSDQNTGHGHRETFEWDTLLDSAKYSSVMFYFPTVHPVSTLD